MVQDSTLLLKEIGKNIRETGMRRVAPTGLLEDATSEDPAFWHQTPSLIKSLARNIFSLSPGVKLAGTAEHCTGSSSKACVQYERLIANVILPINI